MFCNFLHFIKKADFYFHAVHHVKCDILWCILLTSINNSIYVELQNYLFDTFYRNHKLMLLNNIQTQMSGAALL